ncbi:MAG: hypothetical protein HZB50_10325 [Chloroflexi bacterium]|nr:hypothetical protein [Chloroflexota bacterium]
MISELQNVIKDLNSPVDSVRLSAVKQLGNSGHPNTEILEALQKIKRNDKNKFIKYTAKVAIKKLNTIFELTGTDRPLSELSDRELIERLLVLQVENKKAISSTQSLLFFVFNVALLILLLLPKTL